MIQQVSLGNPVMPQVASPANQPLMPLHSRAPPRIPDLPVFPSQRFSRLSLKTCSWNEFETLGRWHMPVGLKGVGLLQSVLSVVSKVVFLQPFYVTMPEFKEMRSSASFTYGHSISFAVHVNLHFHSKSISFPPEFARTFLDKGGLRRTTWLKDSLMLRADVPGFCENQVGFLSSIGGSGCGAGFSPPRGACPQALTWRTHAVLLPVGNTPVPSTRPLSNRNFQHSSRPFLHVSLSF